MPTNRSIYIYLAPWDHFKPESGFNVVGFKIIDTLNGSHHVSFISNAKISMIERILFRIFKMIGLSDSVQKKWTPFNQDFNLFQSIVIFFKVVLKNTTIILLASEDQYCGKFLSNYKLRKNSVLFIHQPPSWFIKEKVDISSLKDVKQIIVLSESQKIYFEENLSRPINIIKHGVDLSSFVIKNLQKKNLVLIVGQHLRDFEVIVDTVKMVLLVKSETEFHFVIPIKHRPKILNEILNKEKVYFYDNIPTSDLVDLYNQAKLTFIPLIDSTANNTIAESLACGTPVLTNNVGDMLNYFTKDCGIITSDSNPKIFTDFILKIVNNEILFAPELIRHYAEEHFDWSKIINSHLISKIIN